jgi:hypothetical protein
MKLRRRLVLPLVVATAAIVAAPTTAYAYEQQYCGVVKPPNVVCPSTGLHSWDSNMGWYPGPTSHNVWVCQMMYNANTGQFRTGMSCDLDTTSHWYGVTNVASYNAKVYIDNVTCCAHTIWGYAVA